MMKDNDYKIGDIIESKANYWYFKGIILDIIDVEYNFTSNKGTKYIIHILKEINVGGDINFFMRNSPIDAHARIVSHIEITDEIKIGLKI